MIVPPFVTSLNRRLKNGPHQNATSLSGHPMHRQDKSRGLGTFTEFSKLTVLESAKVDGGASFAVLSLFSGPKTAEIPAIT
jgi:hypothetical protein